MLHTRDEIVSRAQREFDLLDRLVAGLDASTWNVTCTRREGEDVWRVRDAFAHITARKQDFVGVMQGRPYSRGGPGVHAYNHQTFLEWRDRPAHDLIEWHLQVQDDLMTALGAAPGSWFAREAPRPWPGGVDGHSAKHRTLDIEQALKRYAKPGVRS